MDEIKVLVTLKKSEIKICESFKQMYKKLLDVDKQGKNTDGFEMGKIRQDFSRVIYIKFKAWIFSTQFL